MFGTVKSGLFEEPFDTAGNETHNAIGKPVRKILNIINDLKHASFILRENCYLKPP